MRGSPQITTNSGRSTPGRLLHTLWFTIFQLAGSVLYRMTCKLFNVARRMHMHEALATSVIRQSTTRKTVIFGMFDVYRVVCFLDIDLIRVKCHVNGSGLRCWRVLWLVSSGCMYIKLCSSPDAVYRCTKRPHLMGHGSSRSRSLV